MPKSTRRAIPTADVNRTLSDPALLSLPRDVRRVLVPFLRSLDDVRPWRGSEGD